MQQTHLYLQNWWSKVVQKPETAQDQPDAIFADLVKRYTASGRYYHNTTHLAHLFTCLTPHQNQLTQPEAVIWAVFYHDVIYNPLRKDNEARSAQYAQKMMQRCGVMPQTIQLTCQLISATQYHLAPQDALPDFYYFLDADLAILGELPEKYQQYAQAIRKEYRLVPDVLYNAGRRKVLLQLLHKPDLYYTPAFKQQLQEQAKQNIQHELDTL